MVTPPSNGHLALKSAPMRPVLNFTQALIEQGQLLFVHKGAMSGGFNFQVNDGVNFSPRQIFSITASALLLSLETNLALKVFPGSSTPITTEHLQAVTNDNSRTSNRTITFNVIRRPKLGRLVTVQPDSSTLDISTFTQDMVDRKEVVYIQMPVESVGWAAMDSMSFSVASPPASLDTQTFKIDISYENERSSHEVWFQVRSLPQHGVILVGERNLTKEKPNFSQFIVNKYGITYKHDNSESTQDFFTIDIWVNPKGKSAQRPLDDIDVVEEQFNITIIPVNDQPPVLKTKAPSLKVIQELANISGSEPLFQVVSQPKYGKVVRTKLKNSGRGLLAETFTFEDVRRGQVALELSANMTGIQELNDSLVFVLKAANIQPAKGEFHFTVVPYDPMLYSTTKTPNILPTPITTLVPRTSNQTSLNGTAVPPLTTTLSSTVRPSSKNQQKFKGRNRWGKSNRTTLLGTTLGKPALETVEIPYRNTPVRVESYPQKSSNPLMVILPLLALLLLVIIFVVMVVLLRRHRRRKQTPVTSKPPPSPIPLSSRQTYQGQPQTSPTIPTVTVTPLSPSCPGSPVFDRLLVLNQGSVYSTLDSSAPSGSWTNAAPVATPQLIRTTTPSLQRNQYWV
ncbi:hypothetical protein CRUP_036348 [Coryphaenoides rupestris]|nr:hypothetical protein CRUP_036348 [Coryphaenoides rupestris]